MAGVMTLKNKATLLSACLFAATAIYLAAAPMASAAPPIVEAAIAAGKVGETADGYLDVVADKTVTADVQRTIDEVNIKRRASYTALAAQGGATIDQVGALTAEKLIAKQASGTFYQDADGVWQRK